MKRGHTTGLSDSAFGFSLSLPAFFILALVLLYPLGYALVKSFFAVNLMNPNNSAGFVGLENYLRVFQDSQFRRALSNTLAFTAVSVSFEFILGMALALMLVSVQKGRDMIRTVLVTPIMMAPIITGYMWRFMLSDQFGLVNRLLLNTKVIDQPIRWLTDPDWALGSVILADVWQATPFMMLMLLAGLLSLPQDMYEAADIDGANGFQKFWLITLPLLRPVIMVSLLIRLMDAFRIFGLVFVMTNGGPGNASDTLSLFIYRAGFQRFSVGTASAAGFIMVAIMGVAGALLVRAMAKQR